MLWYVVKLLVLIPAIAAMIWGSLRLAHRMQNRVGMNGAGPRAVRVVETTMLSPTLRLAVLEFHDREILVALAKGSLTRLAEAPARGAGR
ncbi:MAG: flagellar biosynthetic protein FliO [Sphingomonadales bacterium]|nr:flagellar biosynthetic protein FliO [Sphingomonadales bacterium]